MNITEVRINVSKGGKVRAFAQIVIDGTFLVGDIRLLEGKEGTVHVAMPSRRLRNGSFREIAHALNTPPPPPRPEPCPAESRGGAAPGPSGGSSRVQQLAGRFLGEKYWTEEEGEEE